MMLVTAVALLLLAGCSPSSNDTHLQSKLFARVDVIGTRGTGPGQFNKPRSLAVDHEDNLYVADMTGRVQKFSPRGEFLLSWRLPETDLGKPKGMDVDASGRVVVIEPHYQRLNHFAGDGQLVEQWGHRGTNGGEFMLPRAVAVNSRGEAVVSEYSASERVQVFSAKDHQLRLVIGRAGMRDGEFNRPEGVGVDARDRIYVADSCNHRMQVFAPDGQWLATFGRAGRGAGEFSYPYDVRVDRDGRQFVCEFGNSRIQVFDPNHQSLEIIGGAGSEPGRFSNPWGVALDSRGNLYVADAGNHRVQKFIRR